ncbi:MAG: LysR substrate-binding domain-containing protein [Flavobacteriaceae bacterium]|nr:LysR substrate-binding domain-containing protein [Flavobacteriaceae bacterium]
MTITQLNYVLALNKHKNFTKAAKTCMVSQPSLSMQIQKLEEELEISLFDRSKKPIKTTEIGKKLINQFKVIISESEKVNDVIEYEKKKTFRKIKFGISSSLESSLLPLFFKPLKSKFENINIDYFQSKNEEILKLLKGNEVDFIITNSLINDTDLDVMVLYYEPLMILIPDDLKSNKNDIIELKNINTDKLIVPNNSDLRKTINKLFDFKKFNSKIRSNSLLSLFNLSYSGLGMTIVPFLNYRSLNKEKRNKVYHFKKPYPSRKISIVYKKNNLKKHLIIEMSELIKSKLKSIETFSDVKIIDTIN